MQNEKLRENARKMDGLVAEKMQKKLEGKTHISKRKKNGKLPNIREVHAGAVMVNILSRERPESDTYSEYESLDLMPEEK